MRISDWSSDVCSSDLFQGGAAVYAGLLRQWLRLAGEGDAIMCHPASQALAEDGLGVQRLAEFQVLRSNAMSDWQIGRASCRERVVSVRVDRGGRRNIKKKTKDRESSKDSINKHEHTSIE